MNEQTFLKQATEGVGLSELVASMDSLQREGRGQSSLRAGQGACGRSLDLVIGSLALEDEEGTGHRAWSPDPIVCTLPHRRQEGSVGGLQSWV